MKKPAHTTTQSTRGDAQPPAKGKDANTRPASPEAWTQPTTGDAQPQADRKDQEKRPVAQDKGQDGRRDPPPRPEASERGSVLLAAAHTRPSSSLLHGE